MSAIQTEANSNGYAAALRAGGFAKAGAFIARLKTDRALLRRVLMIGGVALVASVALVMWLFGGRYVSTDDAYVESAKLMVSTDVSGLVKDVDVKEGQQVKKGEVLFRIDPQPFRIALRNAEAQLAQTRLTIDAMKQDYQRMQADIRAQQAQVDLATRNFNRDVRLLKTHAVSQSTFDTVRVALSSARDRLSALEHTADTQLAKLGGSLDIPTAQHPQYLEALAKVDEVKRQLDHATVRAPFDGVVAEVDSLQPGTLVISAMSAFSTTSAVGLVASKNSWIEAHMKETDLTRVKKGDPVTFTVDTYPGRTWSGHVEAVSASTGSAFSVLPAENASGNWVKVVQRIPVKIAIDRKAGDPPLRVGMSTIVDIDTGHRRWYRLLNGH
jgi:membrane fusion protein (multidrug efflux system)